MKKLSILCQLLLVVSGVSAIAEDRVLTFVSEANERQTFRKSIGCGLEFVLDPADLDTGWVIKVSPQEKPADPECEDFVWVVTPPYHFQNARYLDKEYGTTAQEAVKNSPRRFNFVLNCADYETERKRVELVIYGSDAPEKEVDDARAKLGSSLVGKGQLWIEDSKITPGRSSGTDQNLGTIDWIKFKVEIRLPADSRRVPSP